MNKKRAKSKISIKSDKKTKIRLKVLLGLSFVFLFLLIFRIAFLQFIQASELKEEAYKQQVANRTISPKRGNIYDSSGKALALSAEVDTVSINPSRIKNKSGENVSKEFIAGGFNTIFGIDYNELLDKLNNNTSTFTAADKVEHDKVLELEQWMASNKIISGIDIVSGTKRFYPYENLASNLIGFTGTDNQGLFGLERSLENTLSGVSGKIITTTDSVNSEIPNSEQFYVAPQDGNDISLTIDVNIQSICERYLSQAVEENKSDGR